MEEDISLENVIRQCGDFHRFQFIHYIFLCMLGLSSGITGFYYVFGLAEPQFRCQLPKTIWPYEDQFEFYNKTHEYLVNQSGYVISQCEDKNGMKCNSFVYDRSVYGKTFTEEADYICGHAIQKTWISTAYQIGTFSILITGPLADKIGRRKMIQILTISLFLITVLTQILLESFQMNIQTKFSLLFINQIVSAIDSYSVCFLLIMELTSSSHTSFSCCLTLISYTIGEILLTFFAYTSHHWLTLKWIISVYFGLSLPYLYFVPESPYWLFSKRKYNELENYLRQIATKNRYSDTNWHSMYKQLVAQNNSKEKMKQSKKAKYCEYIPRLLICGFIEFVTMLLYTKISYGLGASNETLSPYLNFIIGAFVEAIGYLIAAGSIITPLGRKYSLIVFASLTSICVLIIPFLMKNNPLLTVIVSQLGKLSISSTVSVSWIYVPELFPTRMRGLANAIFVFVGSFGSILAPIIEELLGHKYIQISSYIYSGLIIILVFIICTLPETRNRSFDDEQQSKDIVQENQQQLIPQS